MSRAPFVQELRPVPSVEQALRAFAHLRGVVLFDSSLRRLPLGRYSFLSAEPFEVFEQAQARDAAVLPLMEARLQTLRCETVPDLPPFQGGAAGLLSYELGQSFERLPNPRWNPMRLPAAVIGLYDWTLAWDHVQSRCWFVGHDFGDSTSKVRAEERWRQVQELLTSSESEQLKGESDQRFAPHPRPLSPEYRGEGGVLEGMPVFELPQLVGLVSNFDHSRYLAAVQRVIDYIHAGDVFQANLSQQLYFPAKRSPLEHYLTLRRKNPAPFASYFAHDDWAVLSSSPERFLQVRNRTVSTRPIKGTRQRRPAPEADLFTRDELRESGKDRAENVMIVDLLRNDLSRVCQAGSIRVPELCQVEAYETVAHLVSEVQGTLRDEATLSDLLKATFPGGSITGAPKIRAMEIITELEQTARGAYCGSLFYAGFDGTFDSSILIRTMTQRGGWLSLPAGGGIVAQSEPEQEYQETLHKVRGLLRSLQWPNDQ
ncbi:aminodeoxychorismate synthase component I [Planctomicrobium piriforme]|uniref:aminodeoxychorismate synthase n=1 Tax=Planctomicrobium piriforme TaxID=1576369 RepID=A0A1I3G178_9PLAN|nr:aminodeoxychorismate synthase component I [Planctomicrobium piriforme]SFI17245.1 para-aminobenzoate synthetase component 1 [Planctomicrobium piriforme]